jgi:hypothetical protein
MCDLPRFIGSVVNVEYFSGRWEFLHSQSHFRREIRVHEVISGP